MSDPTPARPERRHDRDRAPVAQKTGDTLPTMPEMHIGFRPEESP